MFDILEHFGDAEEAHHDGDQADPVKKFGDPE